jgi:hypothetical protein
MHRNTAGRVYCVFFVICLLFVYKDNSLVIDIMSCNKWLYKYEITFETQGEMVCRKFKSLNEFLHLFGEELNLNRQKCYRIRKKQFSKNIGTTSSGLKKYSKITINDIREQIASKLVRCEV